MKRALCWSPPPATQWRLTISAGYYDQAGDSDAAQAAFQAAAQLSPDYVFPNEIECLPALHKAAYLNQQDAHAPYYLGNFYYAHRCYDEAIEAWERSRQRDPNFPTVWRNLGLAYVNQRGDLAAAWDAYQRAFDLNPSDARVLFELDQLAKRRNELPAVRLERLDRYPELVDQRDDLTIERVALLNLFSRHDAALGVLTTRQFHPWEGGEGKVTGQYVLTLMELAKQRIGAGRLSHAIVLLQQAQTYPESRRGQTRQCAGESHPLLSRRGLRWFG